VRRFHERTANIARGWRARPDRVPGFVPMDPGNRPAPFRRYPGTALRALPTDLSPEGPSAVAVLSGHARAQPARVEIRLLARLLFLSAGVTRILGRGRDRTYFRAAASAGNLHPVESYLVCGALDGLDAGVYHFVPDVFALERLRAGDHRGFLADAAADPHLSATPAVLVITGIPWRTAWKYGARGWRHLYWDAGTMLAHLLAAAEAHGIDVRLLFGFRDAALCRLLGLDGVTEFPLLLAAVGGKVAGSSPADAAAGAPPELRVETTPLSRAPIEFPLITAAQHAGYLGSAEQVRAWRDPAGTALPAASRVDPSPTSAPAEEPIDTVILRQGSTRVMRREAVPADLLVWGTACASRPVPTDVVPAGCTLLSHHLSVHAVDGIEPGLYHRVDDLLTAHRRTSRAQARAIAAHLCLDQALGGDSAYTVFLSARLDEILHDLGDRGYRVAQAEAGVVVGRLQLAASAFGYGATGLTFYDDEVAAAFRTDTACMMTCSVGVPAYHSMPGGPPGRPAAARLPAPAPPHLALTRP
jgi:SagB-type dehydrogenase family enzyme